MRGLTAAEKTHLHDRGQMMTKVPADPSRRGMAAAFTGLLQVSFIAYQQQWPMLHRLSVYIFIMQRSSAK